MKKQNTRHEKFTGEVADIILVNGVTKYRADVMRRLRDRFAAIAEQATQAQHMDPVQNENVCDLLDSIDNDVQTAIALINELREQGS